MDATMIKVALKSNFEYLSENLDLSRNILSQLYSEEVITKEQFEHVTQEEQNKGATLQVKLFLKYLLDDESENGQKKVEKFISLLQEKQPWHYDQLVKGIEDFEEGKLCLGLRDHMVKVYKDINFHKIQSLPGEKFHLNLCETDFVLPLAFNAEECKLNDKANSLIDEQHVCDIGYCNVRFDSVDEIVCALQKHSKRSILCTALAGCGKTTLVHRLVCQWMNNADEMKGYRAVFAIAIRDVDFDLPLLEILGSDRHGLGFLDKDSILCLKACLDIPDLASKLLFILDGVDERTIPHDCDVYKLITGDLYPNVKVLITSRPEAPILENIQKLHHAYKVEILGTTKTGVYEHLRNIIDCQQSASVISTEKKNLECSAPPTKRKREPMLTAATMQDPDLQGNIDAKIKDLVKECEDKMVTFNLLKIPLYLTLTGYVFSEQWAKYLSFKDFTLTDTTTKLFNSVFLILLRHWLKHIGRKNEADKLTFGKNPLGQGSTLSNDIKLKLLMIGRMSYDLIMDQQYSFTSDCLAKYFIDREDIQQTGFFCVSQNKEKIVGFFRHKQLQEYMAALYLSHEKLNCLSFAQCITSAKSSEKKQVLSQIFSKISNVIPFLFGLHPEFGVALLHTLQNNLGVSIDVTNVINLGYEALLSSEASHADVHRKLAEVLSTCSIIKRNFDKVSVSSTAHKFCSSFSVQQIVNILRNLYGLNVSEQDGHWLICKDQSQQINKLTILALDWTLYFFLLGFKFPNIHHVSIDRSYLPNIQLIQRLFPQVKYLFVKNMLKLHDTVPRKLPVQDVDVPPTLTHVHISFVADHPEFSSHSITRSLLKQSHLQSLTLNHLDILEDLDPSQHEVTWKQLETLQLYLDLENMSQKNSTVDHLIWLLQGTPKLQLLTIYFYNKTMPESILGFVGKIIDCIDHHLKYLGTFCLYNIKQEFARDLCSQLQNLPPQVKTLKLNINYFELGYSDFTEALNSLTNVDCVFLDHIQVVDQLYNADQSTNLDQ